MIRWIKKKLGREYVEKRQGTYIVKRSKDDQFYFVLKAVNGKVILTSEMYKTLQGVEVGIRSVQHNGTSTDILFDDDVL